MRAFFCVRHPEQSSVLIGISFRCSNISGNPQMSLKKIETLNYASYLKYFLKYISRNSNFLFKCLFSEIYLISPAPKNSLNIFLYV